MTGNWQAECASRQKEKRIPKTGELVCIAENMQRGPFSLAGFLKSALHTQPSDMVGQSCKPEFPKELREVARLLLYSYSQGSQLKLVLLF